VRGDQFIQMRQFPPQQVQARSLFWRQRRALRVGVVPGVLCGAYVLASVDPAWLKALVYAVLLPFILVQASGRRWPLRRESRVGVPFGAGVGVLYATTTISGPPLALLFNNQGFVKQEFRAALGLIRVVESLLTAIAYWTLGLFGAQHGTLVLVITPSVLVGIPLGIWVIGRVGAETFRRLCMSFDAWIVGFGLSRVLAELGVLPTPEVYTLWAVVILVDLLMLRSFFGHSARPAPAGVPDA